MLESMLKKFNEFGTTYYPTILDNYPQYESLKIQENMVKPNASQNLLFTTGIEYGIG